MFESVFVAGESPVMFFLMLGAALVTGILFAFLCRIRGRSSQSFLVALSLLPAAVAAVVCLVNGNIGAGLAVAGAFGLVRFRSAQGTAKEIAEIFIAMAGGLAFGMGYLAYGAIFTLAFGVVLLVFDLTGLFRPHFGNDRLLKITVPENLDYVDTFDEVFDCFATETELLRTKSVNMGSMFRLTYRVRMKNVRDEKKMLDAIRTRNGNLEVSLERYVEDGGDL